MPEYSGIPLVFIALIHCVFFSETFYSFPDFDNAPPFLRRHMRAIDFRQLNISENALYVKKWLDFLMSRCEQ